VGPDRLLIVGCGPGAPDCVTPAARAAVEEAGCVIGPRRLLDLFPEARGERVEVSGAVAPALDAAERAEGTAALLVTGDPGFHSLARRIVERFGRERCTVVPGVSSVQVAFARLALPWDRARMVSAHAGQPEESPAALSAEPLLAVLGGNPATAPWLAELGAAVAPTHRGWLLKDLTLPGEEIREVDPAALRREALEGRTIVVFARRDML